MMESNLESAARGYEWQEGLDLAAMIASLWKKRFWVILGTALGLIAGITNALFSRSIYYSQATIALKEGDKGGGSAAMLSQLGGLGGMVASQLGIGNTNLTKIEVILKGHDLAESVIRENGLLPKLFPENWSEKDSAWKDSAETPTVRDGVEALGRGVLQVKIDEKRKLIHVGINSHNPRIAKEIVEHYLSALNHKLLTDVKAEATANREYLEEQFYKIVDPVMQEKISAMIASEIEKFMLVSSRSFEVLETPVVPIERVKPKRKLIVLLSLLIGFMASVAFVLISPAIRGIREKIAAA